MCKRKIITSTPPISQEILKAQIGWGGDFKGVFKHLAWFGKQEETCRIFASSIHNN